MGTGSFPGIPGLIPDPIGPTKEDLFGRILGDRGAPTGDGGGGEPPFPTMNELPGDKRVDEDDIRTFALYIKDQGGIPDLDDPEQARAFMTFASGVFFEEPAAGGGAAGRTQFESERLLDLANVQLAEERARSEAFAREESRQRAGSEAFNRVKSKMDLLNLTDQLADARRESAVDSLIAALPFMVNPGTEFTPGFEPFGVGQELGSLLGANVPTQQLPTAQLPLQELANPLLALQPESISEGLDPLLTAPGTPQIPGV
jgi:hypothetical protein